MDCCSVECGCHGHAFTRRRWMWGAALTSIAAMLGGGVGLRGVSRLLSASFTSFLAWRARSRETQAPERYGQLR